MLVEYTTIASLSQAEQSALRGALRGLTLESTRQSFSWSGKVFNMGDVLFHKQMWENSPPNTNPANILLG
jgi:hypothetical protein